MLSRFVFLTIFCFSLGLFQIEASAGKNHQAQNFFTDDVIGSSLAMSCMIYALNKPLSFYQKKYPESLIPFISKLFLVHPSKVYLILSGISRIGIALTYEKILNYLNTIVVHPSNDKLAIKKMKTEQYQTGSIQLLLGLLATYVCYKDF